MSTSSLPTCRWGIITTGLISSWFVSDLLVERTNAKANHVVHAIGASSLQKTQDFIAKFASKAPVAPKAYGSYAEVYNDPEVDCIYIGSPHSFHKRDCLAAIAAGKNVLCEKAFTLNAKEAKEVFAAAKAKGVYVAEAMWLRHRPLVADLQELVFEKKAIGTVLRSRCDFSMFVDLQNLPATSRLKTPDLGAGSLLDIGVYSLTWALLSMENPKGPKTEPKITASQTFVEGVEVMTSALLNYDDAAGKRHSLITSSTTHQNDHKPAVFCTIEGTEGYIEVSGLAPSVPASFAVFPPKKTADGTKPTPKSTHDYTEKPMGFVYEADNTALDIAAGKKESVYMPWGETIRVMEMMDDMRRQGGTVYAVDKE